MSEETHLNQAIERHYGKADLSSRILAALSQAGKDIGRLRPEDLAPIDEFHVRGREATLELAHAAGFQAGQHVLDVGSGLGGPSRCLAAEFGCRVTGIDLTDEYCRAASMLAERVGLAGRVQYRQADALRLPFEAASFDAAWTQHVAMNIPDKAALYREIGRVLRPGGVLAIYDILAGPGGPVVFPVPWARTPETSFLATPEALRGLLQGAGFGIVSWEDATAPGRAWFQAVAAKIERDGLPPLGFHLLLGGDFAAMALNMRRNLDEGRIVLARVVARSGG